MIKKIIFLTVFKKIVFENGFKMWTVAVNA